MMIANFYNLNYKDKIAIIADEFISPNSDEKTIIHYSYQDLIHLSDEFNTALNSENQKRKLVLICAKNNIASVCAYLSCLRHNHVAILLAHNVDTSLKSKIIDQYKPNFIYEPIKDNQCNSIYTFKQYQLYQHNTQEIKLNSNLALLLSTSGSTGSPKLVRLSAYNLQINAQVISEYLKLDGEQRALSSLPLNYSFGLSVLNSHLYAGASIVLSDETIMQKRFWQLLQEQKVTSFSAIPFTFNMLKLLRFNQMQLPHLQYIAQAGGHLDEKIAQEFALYCQEKKIKLYLMYGQTEASPRMSYLEPEQILHKPNSIGKAIDLGRFELRDENNHIINTPHTIGELIYYGPNVSMGYAYNINDLNLGDDNHGVLYTNDLAYFDEEHYWYIKGRKSRLIKLSGIRYSLDEIEQLLKSIYEHIIITGEDDNLLIAIISSYPEYNQEIVHTLKAYLQDVLHIHSSMFKLKAFTQEEIPYNEAGKIQYHQLIKAF